MNCKELGNAEETGSKSAMTVMLAPLMASQGSSASEVPMPFVSRISMLLKERIYPESLAGMLDFEALGLCETSSIVTDEYTLHSA